MSFIVACSDPHLDHRTHGISRYDEIARAMHQAKAEAIKRRASLFVCGGDLADPDSGSIVYRLLALCVDVMMELEAEKILQVWIKGNHDGQEGESLLTPLAALARSLSSAIVAEGPVAQEVSDGMNVLALPHGGYEPANAVLLYATQLRATKRGLDPKYPMTVVVSHCFPIEGLEPGEESSEMPRGGACALPLAELGSIPGRVLVLSGHYHRRQTFRPSVASCPPIQIIGSIATLTHGEESNGEPGFIVIEIPDA